MTNELRTVLDTGVVVSAILLPRSVPRQAVDLAVKWGRLLVSEETIVELDEVLRRPKFDRYVAEPLRLEFLEALVRQADVIDVVDQVTACRDPKDDKVLSLAVSGSASHIVTGDADLLVLHPYQGIDVLNPDTFVSVVGQRS